MYLSGYTVIKFPLYDGKVPLTLLKTRPKTLYLSIKCPSFFFLTEILLFCLLDPFVSLRLNVLPLKVDSSVCVAPVLSTSALPSGRRLPEVVIVGV